jgi:hypothetical protein
MEAAMNTTMRATVRQVCPRNLLVCDHSTAQEVLVHTADACRFSSGDCVCIHFNGIMTMSIPPQITASCIHRIHCCC